MPPLNNEFESNVPPETWEIGRSALFLVMVHINSLFLITHFCCEFCFVAIMGFLKGHFGPKFGGLGHKDIFKDQG